MSSQGNQSSFSENLNQSERKSTGQRDRNTSFRPMNSEIQDDDPIISDFRQSSATKTGPSSQGWHEGSKYSFTASDLVHPDEHTTPDE